MSLAKGLAAERARQVLADEESPHLLSRICDCGQVGVTLEASVQEEPGDLPSEAKRFDDETEAGFAALAQRVMTEVHGVIEAEIDDNSTDDVVRDEEEEEVAKLLEKGETNEALITTNGHGELDNMNIDCDTEDVGQLTKLSSMGI